jgi:hypothetical protein
MHALVGPIILKEGGYAFDLWTPQAGLSRGYPYRRIEDANYARNVEIRSRRRERSGLAIDCSTLDEFTLAIADREVTFRALVSNLEARPVGPTHPHEGRRRIPIAVVQDQ